MALLTFKEYEETEKVSHIPVVKKKEPIVESIIEKEKINFYFMHPERGTIEDAVLNFFDEDLKMIDGKIITDNENIKAELLRLGYIFMYQKEEKNG